MNEFMSKVFWRHRTKKIILKINVHLNQIHSSRKFEKQTQVFVSLWQESVAKLNQQNAYKSQHEIH